jgi:hypothetical protein
MIVLLWIFEHGSDHVTKSLLEYTCRIIAYTAIVLFVMFTVTRLHMLHTAVARLRTERKNEAWLLQECQKDDFYHNLKQHSSLCDDVSARAEDAVILHAREVIENTYICHFDSCAEMLYAITNLCARYFFYISMGAIVIFTVAPSLLVPYWRRCMNRMDHTRDTQAMRRYNYPFGDVHYVNSHRNDYEFRRLQRVHQYDTIE